MRVVGLMSGTSADGIDAALVDWPDGPEARPFELIAYRECPHPEALQAEIHRLAAGELASEQILAEQIRLDRVLADAFADAALSLLEKAGVDRDSIDGVASHGQTIAHHPEHGGSLQIGCPARLAERLALPVIADFRRRDLAMDGEGAPLAPFFHHAVFADARENRGVLNLGGIANLTWLPAGGAPEGVMAFDVGPANSLLDGVISLATKGGERFDRDGARGRAGCVVEAWLRELLKDPYFERPPPKSTGREHYGMAEARTWLGRAQSEGVALDDLMATLTAFSVRAIAQAWEGIAAAAASTQDARLYVGGGGARNSFVMDSLAEHLPGVVVESMDAGGVPADAAEAMAFSLMGRNTLLGIPNQLPQCTGVAEARVLGVIHGGEWR
jgi:anhydro-N-acetylmuramic acid kinase